MKYTKIKYKAEDIETTIIHFKKYYLGLVVLPPPVLLGLELLLFVPEPELPLERLEFVFDELSVAEFESVNLVPKPLFLRVFGFVEELSLLFKFVPL